ncbi:F-box/LRR-repeat protein [Raphanus sativus]|nr:F-box/LRR-repeat protein [Raphanus sativus]
MSRFFPQEDLQQVQSTNINNRTMVDIISTLPSEMRQLLLSFLPTRHAALTSSLSKAWRDEFCLTTNLKLELYDDTADINQFVSFVNRILDVRGGVPNRPSLQKFLLTLNRAIFADEAQAGTLLFQSANRWISFALDSRVTTLTLGFYEFPDDGYVGLPHRIFTANFLVNLRISTSDHVCLFDSHVPVLLPSLKSLRLDMVGLGAEGQGFHNLLRGCPVIEELEMKDLAWFTWPSSSVSSKTLKTLSICWDIYGAEDERPRRFMSAICNVKKLFLHADTLQVLAFACPAIPPFPNLTELTIESHQDQLSDWDALPVLLNNCPQLHTLVFMGLTHQAKNTCGNVCRCEGGEVPQHSCLEASPARVLKIHDFGQATAEMDRFLVMVRHFLVTMPHLERFTVYCDGSTETRANLSRRIRGIRMRASPMCRIEVIGR